VHKDIALYFRSFRKAGKPPPSYSMVNIDNGFGGCCVARAINRL